MSSKKPENTTSPYCASPARYDTMTYRRCGRSGLQMPAISFGLWHNFGDVDSQKTACDMVLRAFDLGITHSSSTPSPISSQ
ncbi:MAG: hypothetical protein WC003_14170 [Terrimicrobiaceae bacterium]